MDKIKRFIDCYVPVTTCTLRCHYCYITMHRLFNGKLPDFIFSPSHVRKALSKERVGGTCLINFCAGGETLLTPKIVEYVSELLEEGHYIMIVTNATVSKRIEELLQLPKDLLKHLFFKFSYHYLELKKRDLLVTFFDNVKKVRDAGCSFTLEITPNDELIPYIDELKHVALENVGAIPHVTVARDERYPNKLPILTSLSREDYCKIWSSFNSKLFEYKMAIFGQKRCEFCYAGDWSLYLNLQTGVATQCYKSSYRQNIFDDLSMPIRFRPVGNNCKELHCYNGHVWLTLGDIPELQAPSYGELRNRKCLNGQEWLNSEMKHMMDSKLYESNEEYSLLQKFYINTQTRVAYFCKKMRVKYETIVNIVH